MFSIRCNSCAKSWRNQKRSAIESFINKYNWAGINFLSEKDVWEKFECNNVTIALNIFYLKKEKIYPAYVSKHNSNLKKQVIFLMKKIWKDGFILQ